MLELDEKENTAATTVCCKGS